MIRFTNYPVEQVLNIFIVQAGNNLVNRIPNIRKSSIDSMKINFYERYQPEDQLSCLEDALKDGFLSTDGKYAALLKNHFTETGGIRDILFTTSATAALELSIQMIALKPGEEVIIPSYTFPSAGNAVIKYGGIPILCDIDTVTKNISLEDAALRITEKTRAIIPTHYAGISCDMKKLMELAGNHGIAVIEDAAQSVCSQYEDQPLGTMGDYGAYSFHYTKNFSCGEGGAFLCKDPSLMENAEILRDNGTNRAQFFRSQVSSYSWQCMGSNFMMSEACAALLYPQLLDHEIITAKRKAVADAYHKILGDAADRLDGRLSPMEIPGYAVPNHHIYYVNCRDLQTRETIRKGMLADGIDARTHFVPLHLSDFGKALGYAGSDLPNCVSVSETLLRLPIHTEMTESDCEAVADSLIKHAGEL